MKFSFKYANTAFEEKCIGKELYEERNQTKTVYDLDFGVKVTNICTRFDEFDGCEWVTWFENCGEKNSEIFSEINDCDFDFEFKNDDAEQSRAFIPFESKLRIFNPAGCESNGRDEFFCFTGRESNNIVDGILRCKDTVNFKSDGGRSSQKTAPFFNINCADEGLFLAIGWSGQWNCTMTRNDEIINIRTGVENAKFYLKPGEKIRTSSVVVMKYSCSLEDSFNKWRRFVKKHFSLIGTPGREKYAPICFSMWGGMPSELMVERIRGVGERKLGYNYAWIDAGWNGDFKEESLNEFEGEWAGCVGDWRINKNHHADNFLDVRKAVEESGLKLVLWFEPERAVKGTKLTLEHPEFFLKKSMENGEVHKYFLLNLGQEEAFKYCFEMLSEMIEKINVKCYRQDFNFSPLEYWRENDEENRYGITEIKHIMGLYRLWDALLERFPDLIIDNCASGGRRIDIETLRRSVPLWRSDAQCPANPSPEIAQIHTMSFNLWMPYSTTGPGRLWGDDYRARSAFGAGMTSNYWYSASDKFDISVEQEKWVRKSNEELSKIQPLFCEDFYLLVPNSLDDGAWCAYQLNSPEKGEGAVMIFRRPDSPYAEAELKLYGLEDDEYYEFTDTDSKEVFSEKGSELKKNLMLKMSAKRSSKLMFYTKKSK